MTNEALSSMQRAIKAVVGETAVYIGDLPELDTACIALRPTDGYPSTLYLGMPETLEPLVEVLVRDVDYASGTTNSTKALQALNNYTDDSVGIILSKVVGSPGYLGRDTNGFGEWHFIVHVSLVFN